MNHTITITKELNYDLLVCGAGPSGLAAALAARRMGLSVLLAERTGQIGGMGTSGLVSHWLSGRTHDCQHWVVGGIFRDLAIKARKRGVALIPDMPDGEALSPHGWTRYGKVTSGIPFDPYKMAAFLDEQMEEAGVDVLFFTDAVDTIVEDCRLEAVVISNKSGFARVNAVQFVDATGDADIAALAGCDYVLGREEDRLMTPVTLQVHMDSIDADTFAAYQNSRDTDIPNERHYGDHATGKVHGYRFRNEIQALMDRGEWPFSFNRLISVQMLERDTFMVNTSRMTGYDGTNAASVSKAMAQGRKETLQLLDILRRNIPGFKNARIKGLAPSLGVRETRRIRGDFFLTMNDLAEGKAFADVIAFVAGSWDLPDPHKPSLNEFAGEEAGLVKKVLPIPFRVMIPNKLGNLICPGRAVSVERPILGPYRDQAGCIAMGEAAGTGAALAQQRDCAYTDLDFEALRSAIRSKGGIVDLNQILENPVY